ncbi:hypothetical protein M406DRAFT_351573 [Cryphonectria parasitica EP155]|uniref:Amidohydrolase-related domain-containing protein n=1 Tax=Cryphonectria parasitica (strain ATCC 38755 / EP155) TaxID=660469 RepID=A0A9P4Y0D8_CRYP1|nr:uncharacterized protein M406DRAFT_351573 [Cryphonectria parasitica EP155]KAF3764082.1 hypothetical protein M406DRAFT_351573 [Cryphonectria parasitica EP155]
MASLLSGVRMSHCKHGHVGEDDIYPDTDYPLRPAVEPWDIATSYPYPRTFSKTVNEGTWLRIATHPTRNEIVFDMLGDLYCMSTEEGQSPVVQAHAFLPGIPFDKEAEFSSDGSQLVFISDAGFGVDNIWTLPYTSCADMARLSAQEVRDMTVQQTNATFRFFSSPAIHPTEPKILATKWYLTGRPNGAGEIWEFPLRTTQELRGSLPERDGRRIVGRKLPGTWPPKRYPESQLGAEQARYSPSGDGIIFTRNVKDDDEGKFSYNKDVHAGINAVFLFNTSTAESTQLVAAAASAANKPASPGGANMPRLSRDGRTLAFVRRVDDKSVLALKDMQSGTVHYLWDGLTYDLSTIPAFMGAYPNYGWAANDTSLVIWSQGHIWQIPVAQNARGERIRGGPPPKMIPFRADIVMALGTTRYNENNQIRAAALSSSLQVRSLRGLRSDHLGQSLVFEAAGDNFVVNVSSAKEDLVLLPKPEASRSCYGPSFIQGSSFILQACWDTRNLTTFFLTDPMSAVIQPISGIPRGRYLSPVSNGDWIFYVRTGKDYMFGDVEETFGEGIWMGKLSLSSAHVSRLTHLRSLRSSQETKLELRNVHGRPMLLVQDPNSVVEYDIETGALRTITTGKTSVEMTAASNLTNTILAFRDFQHIWLCASMQQKLLGIWSKPGDAQTPKDLVRLSEHGGHDVVISGDARTVFWLFGPRLYSADIQRVISACEHANLQAQDTGECALPYVFSRYLNATFDTALSEQFRISGGSTFAITNASLISMDPSAPRIVPNATIVLDKGAIIKVGTGSEIDIHPGAHVLDVEGGAVLPGFVDIHGHWGGFINPYPQPSWEMETFLGYGVTTIHNPASKNVHGMVERSLIEKGRMYGPRVFHTGDVLYGSTQAPVYTEINSRAEARSALLRIKTEGGDSSFSAKNYQLSARSARQRLLLEATELGMLIVPEGGWSLDWDLTYFIDGYTSLEHPVPVPELYDDVLSLISASGSSYTPLAVMNYGGIFGQHWIHQTVDIPGDKKLRNYVKHDILESLTEVKQAPKSSYQFFNTTKSTAKLASRGVRTNVGAHGEQPIGLLYHSEMLIMSLGGQEPYEVLRHATIGSATSLGLGQVVGSVEGGKLADLVIYPPEADSIENLWKNSMHMKYVMRGGTLFSVEDGLVEVWPRAGRRQERARLNPEDEIPL